MKRLEFNTNWNNKLECGAFTTIRLSDKYEIGDMVEVRLKGTVKTHGIIRGKRCILLDMINNFIAYIDTGYNADECKNILTTMYKKKTLTGQSSLFIFI